MDIKYETKTYRIIELDGNRYYGKDACRNRESGYIFDGFPQNYFKGKKILDLGCAAGGILFELYKKDMGFGIGVDIDSNKMKAGIDIVKKHKINNIEFFNIDFFESNDQFFDCIFILNLLHHLPDPYMVLDFACKFCKEFICIEMTNDSWYVPYSRDKKTKTAFSSPLGGKDFKKYLFNNGFECIYKKKSLNQKSFKGGIRYVCLFKKEAFKGQKYLIIGPGASGKSTLISDLVGQPGKYESKAGRKNGSNTFESNSVLLLAPTYGLGHDFYNININAWIKVLNKERVKAMVCYVPKHILIKRLVKRLKERRLKGVVSEDVINEAVDMLIDKNVDVDDKLNELGSKYGNDVKETLMKFFCKDIFFSYDELYKKLDENNIEFRIINTFSKEEEDG